MPIEKLTSIFSQIPKFKLSFAKDGPIHDAKCWSATLCKLPM